MSRTKKRSPFNQEMAIRGANRRLFARSPLVIEKLNESRQEFVRYKKDGSVAKKPWVKRQCEVCSSWVNSSKITIDHIDPVVPPEGFPSHFDIWERITLFLKRLWCDKSNLQRICCDCHDNKTYKERIARLLIKYTEELDLIEANLNSLPPKELRKTLSKYIAKKKTPELMIIVQRAQELKNRITS